MAHQFTAIFERAGDWYLAYSPEIPGANGQGRTEDEARQSLAEAIALILRDRHDTDGSRPHRDGEIMPAMRQVGHRSLDGDGLADQRALVRTAEMLRGTTALVPRGVYRFRTFDEAERWLTEMIRTTHAHLTPTISSASAGR